MAFFVKKPSEWQFVTSSTGGVGVEFVAVEGGRIWLQDPGGKTVTFRYGAAGVGLAAGLKLPKIGKLELKVRGKGVGTAVAPAFFPNTGKVYVLESLQGNELTADDITGVCVFAEVYGGLVAGGSATAMIFGMSPIWLAATLLPGPSALASAKMLSTATGVLLMAGVNVGIQGGVGAGIFVGGLY